MVFTIISCGEFEYIAISSRFNEFIGIDLALLTLLSRLCFTLGLRGIIVGIYIGIRR